MSMRRILQWLGHLERMADSHITKCLLICRLMEGKRAVGGQKRRWNDLVMRDLKRCELSLDWCDFVQERGAWWGREDSKPTTELNKALETAEKEERDER